MISSGFINCCSCANFALVYSYFMPPEAIRGMQVRAHSVVSVDPNLLARVVVVDDLAMMMNEVVGVDVEIVASPSVSVVEKRVARPKSV